MYLSIKPLQCTAPQKLKHDKEMGSDMKKPVFEVSNKMRFKATY